MSDRLALRLVLLQSAPMDTMDIIPTPALLTATTALTGLPVGCSLVRGRGSMVRVGSDTGAGRTVGAVARGTVIRVGAMLTPAAMLDAGMLDTAVDFTVPQWHEVASTPRRQLVAADFMAAVDPMLVVGSTVAAPTAATPTAVVIAKGMNQERMWPAASRCRLFLCVHCNRNSC